MLVRSLKTGLLHIEDWSVCASELWCVLGPNGSGKSLLAEAICEAVSDQRSIEDAPQRVALLSLESLQLEYEQELSEEDTDFLDRIDFGSTGLEILMQSGAGEGESQAIAAKHGVSHLLGRGCRQFSSGETRRIYLLREILRKPDLLILDEPFEGLDKQSCADCWQLIETLGASGMQILINANRIEDVGEPVTHLAVLREGRFIASGPKEAVLKSGVVSQWLNSKTAITTLPAADVPTDQQTFSRLLRMRNVGVQYDKTSQFRAFDWELAPGQHTLITGPNGCGKSTLLKLLTGDHPQCYCNDIEILGFQRGSGESIWDIKRLIGFVSSELHRDFRVGGIILDVTLSGFFDSIGLYEIPSAAQVRLARDWLGVFGMAEFERRPFRNLSFGQQRLALIARALVKSPPLLILDEPSQGLDELNRHLVLDCLEKLAALKTTTILFVSHRQDERLKLFQNEIAFEPDSTGASRFRAVCRKIPLQPRRNLQQDLPV